MEKSEISLKICNLKVRFRVRLLVVFDLALCGTTRDFESHDDIIKELPL